MPLSPEPQERLQPRQPISRLVREDENAAANQVNELWHVVHDWGSPQGDWLIAGIQQID